MEFIFVDKMRFIFSYKIELIIYVNVDMILFIFPNKKIDVKFASLHWLLQLWCYTKCRQWSGRQIWFWEKIRLDSYSLIVGGIHQGARALQPPGQARAKKTKKNKKTSTILQHFRNNSVNDYSMPSWKLIKTLLFKGSQNGNFFFEAFPREPRS